MPNYAPVHNNLGALLLDQGKFDEAATCYQQALAIQPDYAVAHNNLGGVLLDQGQIDEAAAHYRQAWPSSRMMPTRNWAWPRAI